MEAYIAVFTLGQEMKVVSYDDEYCTIYLNDGLTAKVSRTFVKLEGDSQEETFTGYIRKNSTVLYKDYQLRSEGMKLGRNKTVEVQYKLPAHTYEGEEIYVVSVDGQVLYVPVSSISNSKVKVKSNSSSSSSSSSGDVWTPPKM